MLVAFGLGGWITGRSSAVRGHDNGLLNGFMVAAVGIPLMLFALGSATNAVADNALSRSTANTRTGLDNAMTASDRITSDGASAGQSNANATANDDARRAARRTAWGTLLALTLAIGAAAAAGYAGAGDDRDDRYAAAVGRRSDSDLGSGTTPGL
jgi:ferric-dicitrate binding protein FerR (iron transport regulator)